VGREAKGRLKGYRRRGKKKKIGTAISRWKKKRVELLCGRREEKNLNSEFSVSVKKTYVESKKETSISSRLGGSLLWEKK